MARPLGLRFRVDPHSALSPLEQIRDQIIHYAHFGLIPPGGRLPSVRELAAHTGLNLKTAFRIYRALARERLVEIQPKSGVFLKLTPKALKRSYRHSLDDFLQRVAREAREFNLSPARLAQLLGVRAQRDRGRLQCAVLECNREQTDLFSSELRRKLNVEAIPVLTTAPARQRERMLRRADVFVTTDFHWDEVSRWAARHRKEAYRIWLNPAFVRLLVRHTRRGLFPLVLTDVSFEPRFRRALSQSVSPAIARRLVFVHYRDRGLRQVLQQARRAYVSPLCYAQVARRAPAGVQLVTLQDMLSRQSLKALRKNLGL